MIGRDIYWIIHITIVNPRYISGGWRNRSELPTVYLVGDAPHHKPNTLRMKGNVLLRNFHKFGVKPPIAMSDKYPKFCFSISRVAPIRGSKLLQEREIGDFSSFRSLEKSSNQSIYSFFNNVSSSGSAKLLFDEFTHLSQCLHYSQSEF